MDGLDEIEAKNRNDAIRRIESFSEQYPSTKIIISCRKNFYMMEKEGESGTLSGFSSYILLDLDDNDIEKYLQNKLGDQTEVFRKAILAKQLHALLRVPFYLISLVTLFLTSQYKLFITHKQKKKLKPNLIASKESQAETLYLVTLSEANGTR
jgi:predicted NACHT family NTPase